MEESTFVNLYRDHEIILKQNLELIEFLLNESLNLIFSTTNYFLNLGQELSQKLIDLQKEELLLLNEDSNAEDANVVEEYLEKNIHDGRILKWIEYKTFVCNK